MESWIFYLNDSLGAMTAVVGAGATMSEAEEDAKTKWDTWASGRPDYTERAPIVSVIYSTISTELLDDNLVGLIL